MIEALKRNFDGWEAAGEFLFLVRQIPRTSVPSRIVETQS